MSEETTTTNPWRNMLTAMFNHGILLLLIFGMMGGMGYSFGIYNALNCELPRPAIIVLASWDFLSQPVSSVPLLLVAVVYAWIITRFLRPNRVGLAYALSTMVSILLGLVAAGFLLGYITVLIKLKDKMAGATEYRFGGMRTALIGFGVVALVVLVAMVPFVLRSRRGRTE